jgi:hypothetical protein
MTTATTALIGMANEPISTPSFKQKIIEWEKITEKQWKKFTDKTEKKLKKTSIKEKAKEIGSKQNQKEIKDEEIQEIWSQFEDMIIATAFNYLSHKNITISTPKRKKVKAHSASFQLYRKTAKLLKFWSNIPHNNRLPPTISLLQQIKDIQESTELIPNAPETLEELNHYMSIKDSWNQLGSQISTATRFLKKTCYKEEKEQTNLKIKQALEERCQNLRINRKRIVQTLTNNFRDKIIIDRLKVKDEEGEDYITIQKDKIFQQINQHYQETFKKRNDNFACLSPEWQKQYSPREYIKTE